ncbi:MAG: alpha-ribazole phosphatase [Bacillota bacterium]
MRIYFIRHGETEMNVSGKFYGWTDCDINEVGKRQAEELHTFFKTQKIDMVYSSDLLRAAHTAKIVFRDNDCEIKYDSDFREMNFGDWEDKDFAYIKEHHAEKLERWQTSWQDEFHENGESFVEFYDRVSKGIDRVVAESKGKNVAVVSHYGGLSASICHLIGAGSSAYWGFQFQQGCYNSVLSSVHGVQLECLNRLP